MPAAAQDEGDRCSNIVRTLLEASPLLALFLAIAAGYAIGQISFAGVSFGAGAVLFTGLIIGAIAPKAAPPGLVGTLGLVMFVYGVGIQYGPQFFAGLRGPGIKYIALAAVGRDRLSRRRDGCSPSRSASRSRPRPDCSPVPARARRRLQAALAAAGNQDPGDRLFGVLSVRRGRADRPDDHHGSAGQTQIRSARAECAGCGADPRIRNAGIGPSASSPPTLPADVKIVAVRQRPRERAARRRDAIAGG